MAESSFRIDNLVSALVGGVDGGLLVWWLVPAAPEASTAPDDTVVAGATAAASPVELPPEAEEGTHERLKTLEKRMYQMQKRVTEQAKVDVYEEGEEGEEKRITLSAADPKFQSAVRAVIDKAKWEQEQIEQDERDQRRDERVARQVDELVKELDLTDDQADQVEIVLQNRAETFRNLRNGENRPVTRSDWRKKFAEIHAQTRKELAVILDDGQLEAYDKHQESQFGPWLGRPRPPRPAPE